MDLAAVLTAIKTKYDNDVDLVAAMPNFYHAQAPDNPTGVWGVYTQLIDVPWYTFTEDMTDMFFDFSGYSDDTEDTNIIDAYKKMTALFDYTTLTVSGMTFIECRREQSQGPTRIDDRWQFTMDYKIWVDFS